MKKMLTAAALLALTAGCAQAQSRVYVSNDVSGTVTGYRLDTSRGTLEPIGTFPAGKKAMSSVVSPDHKMLYVSVRSQPYRVVAYHIEADGQLQKRSETPLPQSMAYLSTDRSGRFLLSASFGGDLVSINAIDGQGNVVEKPVQVVHTGKRAHAVQVDAQNRFLYVTQLGTDQLLQFRFDAGSGRVTPLDPPFINIQHEAATGPRHFVFAPARDGHGQRNMYILNEMAGNITRVTLDDQGRASAHEDVSSVSPDEDMQRGEARPLTGDDDLPPSAKPRIWQADIHITPDGRYLYATERTSSTLTSFRVDPTDGHLTRLASIKTEAQPRGFAIDNSGRFLIESGQKSDHISLYRINPADGALTMAGRYPGGDGANWVTLVEP